MEEEYAELFTDDVRNALVEALKDMRDPVEGYVFTDTSNPNCQYCDVTVKFMKFVSDAAPKSNGQSLLKVKVLDKSKDIAEFQSFEVSRVPTVAFLKGKIRWTGAPLGEEIRALVETIVRLSQGESGLSPETINAIKDKLNGKVKVEVMVTPSCPYCPYAALLSHMVAFEACKAEKCNVLSDVVESYENPDIAEKYQVMSVPTLAVNESVEFIGVPQEENFVNSLIEKQS
ncbi:MAG: thioredoxin family protein [Metallosphaera yellowstonensis]|jgi:Glutaredoxin-like domain protein|uniref:Glutaredoxin-like domain protein n=1 Tax=Metallosphaera yellowstonensis MK1 TaxID=671065 RepID=H2C6A0_9CREN|nr:thioredoxin family protein [Metallosphaera yellowstonensis]EHP69327.1 Glutaredoxin-like domain protein [Metallosphaera yellowstonensis MK1]